MRPSTVKQKVFLCLSTFLFLLLPGICYGEDVTVELVWKFPQPGWLEFEVKQGNYLLQYNGAACKLAAGESVQIGQSGLTAFVSLNKSLEMLAGPLTQITAQNQGIFRIREPGKDWVSYRGDLSLVKEGLNWKLYNKLDREDYLKGVVPIEMSNSWALKGFEALKAQAVAARTYLLKNMDPGGRITDSPDYHQAYWGRSVEGAASQAVEETKGEILVDSDTLQPISVFYSSHNGGYSEETQNVWESHDPHYVSEPDPFSRGVGGFVDSWRFFIAADTLGEHFGLAPVREVGLKKYSSGRVYQVTLLDWLGVEKAVSGGDFVRQFYPYSGGLSQESFLGRLFAADYILPAAASGELQMGYSLLKGPIADSTSIIIPDSTPAAGPLLARLKSSGEGFSAKPRNFGVFVFKGSGWGHGVGMSQWGAYNMARSGYSYESILTHYYKNSKLLKKVD